MKGMGQLQMQYVLHAVCNCATGSYALVDAASALGLLRAAVSVWANNKHISPNRNLV